MELLSLKDIELRYQTKDSEILAINNLNLTVFEGDFVAIVGPSGCGKTTILSLISGLLQTTSGNIFLRGQEIRGPSKNVGYMLQRDQLFEWLTVKKNMRLGLDIQNKFTPESDEYIDELLNKYGLWDFKNSHPSQLSGGMRQRAALIRTLATKPDLLLLDEPFSALDYQTRLNVCNDVAAIIRSEKKTALLVTHDIAEAISMADKIVVLSQRPAYLKKYFQLDFETDVPLKRRECEKFPKWFDTIWKELSE